MAVNKVARGDGLVLIDLSTDTVTSAYDIVAGKVGHLANGAVVTGLGSETLDFTDISASGDGNVTIEGTSGGSATAHTIYLELNDGTDATIPVYYDDAFIGTIITSSAPATYGGKTVDSASLDGVEWYRATGYTTLYEGTPAFYTDSGNYFWIPELANVQPTVGSVWRITINGTAYICTAQNSLAGVIVGNPVHVGGADDGSGVPVAFYNYNHQAWSGDTSTLSAGDYDVKIERQVSA